MLIIIGYHCWVLQRLTVNICAFRVFCTIFLKTKQKKCKCSDLFSELNVLYVVPSVYSPRRNLSDIVWTDVKPALGSNPAGSWTRVTVHRRCLHTADVRRLEVTGFY